MRSLGVRLAFWYALASVLTLTCLFVAGRYMLERHVVNGLELLNAAQFEQIKSRLGRDHAALTPTQLEERLRETTEYSAVLFYIEIHRKGPGTVFRSSNLKHHSIPDLPGVRYDAPVGNLGRMRVSEFVLDQMEVFVATSMNQTQELMRGYDEVFIGLLVVMLLASSGIGFALSRIALRPLRLIQETATHIGSDNLSERIPVSAVKDEMSNLARLLNQMFDRLEAAFNQTRRFTAEASHELKTPLSLVRLQAEKLLIEGGLKPPQEEALQVQLEEIARLNQIIEELLFLSRAEARAITLQLEPHDLRTFLETFASDARVLAESRGARFVFDPVSGGPAVFDGRWIRQVLLNLLTNALNHSPRGGTVTLSSEQTEGGWRVAIEDEGPGVPADQRERIFERFVRLAPGGENGGSGLGLAISRSIVNLHRGRIRAEPAGSGRGLRVVFEIPVKSVPPG